MDELKGQLANSSLFAALDLDDLTEVANLVNLRAYKADTIIIPAEEELAFIAMVASGCLELSKRSPTGRKMTMNMLKNGELFWSPGFFVDCCSHKGNLFLKASEVSSIYFWLHDDIIPILERNSGAMWELCRIIAKRMERVGTKLDELAFCSVDNRLARFLINLADELGDDRIPRTLTLEDIAERIYTSSEVVCRTLYRFSELGLLEVNQMEVILTDRTKLNQVSAHISN